MIEILPVSRREVRDAARLAIQSAAAAAGMFLLMRSVGLPEEFLGIISAVLVVQPSVGHTVGAAGNRMLATLVGSAIGISALLVLPDGYGTAVALAVSMLVMNSVACFKPEWRYGTVAAVALALGSEGNALMTARDRAIAIGLGALIGALVTVVVWPDSATRRARRHLRRALRATAERLDAAVQDARGDGDGKDGDDARRAFHENFRQARDAAGGIGFGDREAIEELVARTERLYNSALILNRVAEETDHAPEGDRELSGSVETIRREACRATRVLAGDEGETESSLRTMRAALQEARERAAENDGDPRQHVLDAAMVFGLGEVMDSLEDLVEASRD